MGSRADCPDRPVQQADGGQVGADQRGVLAAQPHAVQGPLDGGTAALDLAGGQGCRALGSRSPPAMASRKSRTVLVLASECTANDSLTRACPPLAFPVAAIPGCGRGPTAAGSGSGRPAPGAPAAARLAVGDQLAELQGRARRRRTGWRSPDRGCRRGAAVQLPGIREKTE
jgi:hypothetical protein